MRLRTVACGFAIAVLLAGAAQAQAPQVLPPKALTVADAKPDAHGVKRMAVFRGLDKITGRASDIIAPVGVPVKFGTLTLTVQTCHTVPPEEPPETTAFVQIDENQPGGKPKRMFSGWMFASTPALNALEHPTYDVWVVTCKTDEPAAVEPVAVTPGKFNAARAPAVAADAPRPAAPPAAAKPPAPDNPLDFLPDLPPANPPANPPDNPPEPAIPPEPANP